MRFRAGSYEMWRERRPGLMPQRWKVTARVRVQTKRGVLNVVRLHAFPSDQVIHVEESFLLANFRRIKP